MSSLEELNIGGNIAPLPESFGKLRSLKKLTLSLRNPTVNKNVEGSSCGTAHAVNDFYVLPESFGALESLEDFYIDGIGCKLKIPESFGNLGTLKALIIHFVQLELLPDSNADYHRSPSFLLFVIR